MRGALAALLLALALAGGAPAAADPAVPEPAGYRDGDYRAPVPDTLKGAAVVDTAAAEALWKSGAVFVDALPRPPRPKLPEGTLWRPPPRQDIPGSIWLANTGYGELPQPMLDYFAKGLAAATEGDPARPLVFYCLADCWMSWNAAKRAMTLGYSAVHWYPEGTDGWAAAGLPLEDREPLPGGSASPGRGAPVSP